MSSQPLPFQDTYSVQSDLQAGFFGRTLLLKHEKTNGAFICKMIRKEFIGNAEMVGNFVSKIKAIQSLNFTFIVNYTEIYETEATLFLIRPYFDSETLTSFIKNSEKGRKIDINALWRTIAKSIQLLHKHGISSLPIKPSNILIFNEKFVTLTDMYEIKTDVRWALETMEYHHLLFLPPEFFENPKLLGEQSDVWALGVLFAYMNGAKIPWKTRNLFTLVKRLTNVEMPTDLAETYVPIVRAMLQKSPRSRPSMEDMLSDRLLMSSKPRRQSDPIHSQPEMLIKKYPPPLPSSLISCHNSISSKLQKIPMQSSSQTKMTSLVIRRRFFAKMPISAPQKTCPPLPPCPVTKSSGIVPDVFT